MTDRNGVREITAQLLLHRVAKVIVVARDKDKFNAAREDWRHQKGISLGESDARVQFVQCDLSDINGVHAATKQIKQMTVHIHILICNAGELSRFVDNVPTVAFSS